MKIQILGTGCSKCEQLYDAVLLAVDELGLDAEIEKVTEIEAIKAFNVLQTPALVMDGEVKSAGKVLSAEEVKALLNHTPGSPAKVKRSKNLLAYLLLALSVIIVLELKKKKGCGATCDSSCSNGLCTLPIPAGGRDTDVQQELQTSTQPLPLLLDLGADKCVPCKTMAPILAEMRETFAGQLQVQFIDVWQNEGASEKYGIRIIPTQIFFDAEGNELFRHEGFYSREDMLKKWKELGYELEDRPQPTK